MFIQLLPVFILLSVCAYILTAVASWFQSGINPTLVKSLAKIASILTILLAVGVVTILVANGPTNSSLFIYEGLGLSLRFDAIGVIMYTMIAFLAYIVMRFSFNYLEGDSRHGAFLGRLASAIASVQLLVMSGNLAILFVAWVATSISLHRLLLYYPDRPGAIIAARKKFIVARISDLCLAIGFMLIYEQFKTGELTAIMSYMETISWATLPPGVELAVFCLALAAIFKSAQLPTHGWLIEVMETPTPVSALLHAGLLNAGPFLVIRFAFLFNLGISGSFTLILVGALTALFGSLVFLTQTSVKTALSYSSIAHMGFSLLVCGLGAFPAAMLHLVAHSFYKAHSFLSSGSVIDQVRASYVTVTGRSGDIRKIGLGLLVAIASFAGMFFLFGLHTSENYALMFLCLVITLGLSRLLIPAFDTINNMQLILRVLVLSISVIAAFLLLESGVSVLMASSLPVDLGLTQIELMTMGVLALGFASVILLQVMAPMLVHKTSYQALVIHLKNGLYINTLFDRMVGTWRVRMPEMQPESTEKIDKEYLVSDLKLEYKTQS